MDRFKYVEDAIADLRLDPRRMNELDTMQSPVSLLRRAFVDRGWQISTRRNAAGRRTITSADESTALWQSDGKVWRHPETTETLCKSKDWTSTLLKNNGVPTATSLTFDISELDLANELWPTFQGGVVVKPSNSGGSRGVTVGVKTEREFNDAWNYALSVGTTRRKIIVEEVLSGVEVRCFVVGDRVVSSILRLPSFVVGDGHSSLNQLIAEAESARSKNVRYAKAHVTPDWTFLKKRGLTPDSIPREGSVVILTEFHLFRLGNYTPEISQEISPDITSIAVSARKSVPGLEVAAVDILVENVREGTNAKVLELNTAPALSHHLYPAFGHGVNIVRDIANYYTDSL